MRDDNARATAQPLIQSYAPRLHPVARFVCLPAQLMLSFLGGREKLAERLRARPKERSHSLLPFCGTGWRMGSRFVHRCGCNWRAQVQGAVNLRAPHGACTAQWRTHVDPTAA